MSNWDDFKIDQLSSLWGKKTASQIAELIGGVSRNAVIGKAHRLNLEARAASKKTKPKINDKENLHEINKEYKSLNDTKKSHLEITSDIQNLIDQLKDVNIKLWSIEDEKRICEKNKDFSKKFIELARNVYINNDKRAKIKSEINKLLGSNIKEVKEYANY